MLTIIVWAVGAGLLLFNILLRTQILRLEARLRELANPQEQLTYLRKQAQSNNHNKIAAIKALRKKYPEMSLIEANTLWQKL